MRKLIDNIVLFLFLTLVVTGCNSKKDDIESSDNKNLNEVNEIGDYGYTSDIICEAFEKGVKLINYNSNKNEPNWIITDDNSVYLYNIEQLFSETNSNCKKMDFQLPEYNLAVKYNYNYRFYNYDSYFGIYYDDASTNDLKFSIENFDPDMPMIDSHILKFRKPQESNYSLMQSTKDYGRYGGPRDFLGVKNNLIVAFNILYNLDNHEWTLLNEEEVFSVPVGETILDFWFLPNLPTKGNDLEYNDTYINKSYVLTDKGYYRYVLKDESCYKYADVDCEYVLKKDEELSKYKDHILYRDEFRLITDNGHVYELYGYGI